MASVFKQMAPSVAGLANGGFVVVWFSDKLDDEFGGIYGQRYDADGAPQDGEFRINTETLGFQGWPAVAALGGGGFVVIWNSNHQDGDGFGIYGERYRANGIARGEEFRINTHTADNQPLPSVTGLSDGSFVVTWHSVWTGRAVQAGCDDLEMIGLAHLYSAR